MHGLWILDCSTIIGHATIDSETFHNKYKLWNLRLGHVSEKCLVKLATRFDRKR